MVAALYLVKPFSIKSIYIIRKQAYPRIQPLEPKNTPSAIPIYEILRSSLEKAGLFRGYGVYGDRYLLDATFYSHSLIYEILISFGIFFGVILLLLMFSALLCAFIKFRKKQNFGLLLAISSFTICHLLFSYSLWYEQMFGATIESPT